jgi:hypothetical protein
MYTLSFTLKQHTPIIHFQHQQDGATLRATEVKPKLDRFLLLKIGAGNYENGIQIAKSKGWLIGKGMHPALDYKLKIESEDEILNIKIEKNYPNYLGNMGISEDNKGFIISNNITATFILLYDELKTVITDQFSIFLTATNFGNRKSKGFGCFSLKDLTEKNFEKQMLETFRTVYKTFWKNTNVKLIDDHKYLFRKIQDEYKLLKAGDSRNKKESKLRKYVNRLSTPIEWEKPFIQTDIASITKSRMNIKWENTNFHYVRALLGLADHFEFIQQKITVHFSPLDDQLQRFSSPLLFKVFDKSLYIIPNPNHNLEKIKGKKIQLSYKKDGKSIEGKTNKLSIPNIDFDLHDFLNEALKNTSWRKL